MAKAKEETAAGAELVKATETAIATARPDFVEHQREGTEHITRDDMQMPRIGIAQLMSPEIDSSNDEKFIDGLRFGNMFNSVTKVIYGDGPMQFAIVQALPPRFVEFIPKEQGGGVKDPNVPHDDPRTQWGANGEKPVATKFYDFVVMLLPSRELVALSFKSTGIKVAKQLNALISLRDAPLYAGVYSITTTGVQGPKGKYAVPVIKNAGFIAEKPVYDYAKGIFNNLRGKAIVIHTEDDTFDTESMEAEAERKAADLMGR
jgi:hypothetical protein